MKSVASDSAVVELNDDEPSCSPIPSLHPRHFHEPHSPLRQIHSYTTTDVSSLPAISSMVYSASQQSGVTEGGMSSVASQRNQSLSGRAFPISTSVVSKRKAPNTPSR